MSGVDLGSLAILYVMLLFYGALYWILFVVCLVLSFIHNDGSRTGLPFWKAASRLVVTILLSAVATLIWPITIAAIYCCCRGRRPRRTLARDRETFGFSTVLRRHFNWRRRRWLVLLRARRHRIDAPRRSAWWRWTPCGTNRDTDGLRVGVGSLVQHDIEGGQGRVAHNAADLEYRQLVNWVVDHAEEGVFRSIVGYL